MIFHTIIIYITLLIAQISGRILDMILQNNISKEQIMKEIYTLLFWSAIIIVPNTIKKTMLLWCWKNVRYEVKERNL